MNVQVKKIAMGDHHTLVLGESLEENKSIVFAMGENTEYVFVSLSHYDDDIVDVNLVLVTIVWNGHLSVCVRSGSTTVRSLKSLISLDRSLTSLPVVTAVFAWIRRALLISGEAIFLACKFFL